MNDITKETNLQYGQTIATQGLIRGEDFAAATVIGAKPKARSGIPSLLLGLSMIVIGIVCFFIMLRVLFDPYILGGPNMALAVVPLLIIATLGFIVFGSRMLIMRKRHSRH